MCICHLENALSIFVRIKSKKKSSIIGHWRPVLSTSPFYCVCLGLVSISSYLVRARSLFSCSFFPRISFSFSFTCPISLNRIDNKVVQKIISRRIPCWQELVHTQTREALEERSLYKKHDHASIRTYFIPGAQFESRVFLIGAKGLEF